jgi:hypothetical protein
LFEVVSEKKVVFVLSVYFILLKGSVSYLSYCLPAMHKGFEREKRKIGFQSDFWKLIRNYNG